MNNIYNEFSLVLYTTLIPFINDFSISLTILTSASIAWYFYSKKMVNLINSLEQSVDYWKTSYHNIFGILIKKAIKNADLIELNDKLLKANTSLTKEIKIYIPEKKKTWTKKREGTLSRSQVYRRKKADKLPKNWGRIKEVSF